MTKAEIQKAVRRSEHGSVLGSLWRWKDFYSGETRKEWLKHLGPTGIVLFHQEFFADFGEGQLQGELAAQAISPEDLYLSVLAFSIHDLGEATVGDITFFQKSAETENKEFAHALQNIRSLPLSLDARDEAEHAYRQVVMADNQVLGYLFRAIERTEYLNTALTVASSLRAGKGMKRGQELVGEVLAYSLPKVVEFSQNLPHSIGVYLAENKDEVSGMFELARGSVKNGITEKFQHAEAVWRQYEPTISSPPRSHA